MDEAQHRMYEGNRYALAEAGDRFRDRSILPDGDLMLRIDEAAERLPQMCDATQIDPGRVARANCDLAEISAVCEKLGHDALPALAFPEEQDLRDLLIGQPGWGLETEPRSLQERLGGSDDDDE